MHVDTHQGIIIYGRNPSEVKSPLKKQVIHLFICLYF